MKCHGSSFIRLRRKFYSTSIYMHWCIVTVALLMAFERSSQAVWEPQPASRFEWRWTWSTHLRHTRWRDFLIDVQVPFSTVVGSHRGHQSNHWKLPSRSWDFVFSRVTVPWLHVDPCFGETRSKKEISKPWLAAWVVHCLEAGLCLFDLVIDWDDFCFLSYQRSGGLRWRFEIVILSLALFSWFLTLPHFHSHLSVWTIFCFWVARHFGTSVSWRHCPDGKFPFLLVHWVTYT